MPLQTLQHASRGALPAPRRHAPFTVPASRPCPRLPAAPAASSNGASPLPASASAVISDDAVPEGHQGLHSFLYGEGGAEEAHDAGATSTASSSGAYSFHDGEDDGTALLETGAYLDSRDNERPVGVFAVHDSKRNLQYVSFSRNVVLALRALRARVGEERCAFVRVMVFANRAMQTRAALQREADNWVQAAGTLPPGNGAEKELWEGAAAFDPGAMSPEELAAYEEKKTKLQKAMGDKSAEQPEGPLSPEERRARMIAAVEGGDWSAEIEGQTAQTIADGLGKQKAEAKAAGPITTPFARASVHRSVGNGGEGGEAAVPMTVASVNLALDEVRPYLIADGGNVDVLSVEGGNVVLELQGACGTCPSSSATMKMGIERALRATFGDQLKEVVQAGGAVDTSASVEAVDVHLNMLRGAVGAYGGSVEVAQVGGGKAVLRYSGPKPIAYGLIAAVKDKFPDLKEVEMVDAESGEVMEF